MESETAPVGVGSHDDARRHEARRPKTGLAITRDDESSSGAIPRHQAKPYTNPRPELQYSSLGDSSPSHLPHFSPPTTPIRSQGTQNFEEFLRASIGTSSIESNLPAVIDRDSNPEDSTFTFDPLRPSLPTTHEPADDHQASEVIFAAEDDGPLTTTKYRGSGPEEATGTVNVLTPGESRTKAMNISQEWRDAVGYYYRREYEESLSLHKDLVKRFIEDKSTGVHSNSVLAGYVWFNIGRIHGFLGDYFQASISLYICVTRRQDFVLGWFALGISEFQQQRFRSAQDAFWHALTIMDVRGVDYIQFECTNKSKDARSAHDPTTRWRLPKDKILWNWQMSVREKWWKSDRIERPGEGEFGVNGIPPDIIFWTEFFDPAPETTTASAAAEEARVPEPTDNTVKDAVEVHDTREVEETVETKDTAEAIDTVETNDVTHDDSKAGLDDGTLSHFLRVEPYFAPAEQSPQGKPKKSLRQRGIDALKLSLPKRRSPAAERPGAHTKEVKPWSTQPVVPWSGSSLSPDDIAGWNASMMEQERAAKLASSTPKSTTVTSSPESESHRTVGEAYTKIGLDTMPPTDFTNFVLPIPSAFTAPAETRWPMTQIPKRQVPPASRRPTRAQNINLGSLELTSPSPQRRRHEQDRVHGDKVVTSVQRHPADSQRRPVRLPPTSPPTLTVAKTSTGTKPSSEQQLPHSHFPAFKTSGPRVRKASGETSGAARGIMHLDQRAQPSSTGGTNEIDISDILDVDFTRFPSADYEQLQLAGSQTTPLESREMLTPVVTQPRALTEAEEAVPHSSAPWHRPGRWQNRRLPPSIPAPIILANGDEIYLFPEVESDDDSDSDFEDAVDLMSQGLVVRGEVDAHRQSQVSIPYAPLDIIMSYARNSLVGSVTQKSPHTIVNDGHGDTSESESGEENDIAEEDYHRYLYPSTYPHIKSRNELDHLPSVFDDHSALGRAPHKSATEGAQTRSHAKRSANGPSEERSRREALNDSGNRARTNALKIDTGLARKHGGQRREMAENTGRMPTTVIASEFPTGVEHFSPGLLNHHSASRRYVDRETSDPAAEFEALFSPRPTGRKKSAARTILDEFDEKFVALAPEYFNKYTPEMIEDLRQERELTHPTIDSLTGYQAAHTLFHHETEEEPSRRAMLEFLQAQEDRVTRIENEVAFRTNLLADMRAQLAQARAGESVVEERPARTQASVRSQVAHIPSVDSTVESPSRRTDGSMRFQITQHSSLISAYLSREERPRRRKAPTAHTLSADAVAETPSPRPQASRLPIMVRNGPGSASGSPSRATYKPSRTRVNRTATAGAPVQSREQIRDGNPAVAIHSQAQVSSDSPIRPNRVSSLHAMVNRDVLAAAPRGAQPRINRSAITAASPVPQQAQESLSNYARAQIARRLQHVEEESILLEPVTFSGLKTHSIQGKPR